MGYFMDYENLNKIMDIYLDPENKKKLIPPIEIKVGLDMVYVCGLLQQLKNFGLIKMDCGGYILSGDVTRERVVEKFTRLKTLQDKGVDVDSFK